jgi:hypothetical protein
MRNLIKTAVLAASTALLVACGGGGDPMGKMFGHQEKITGILEANKEDPDKAAAELEKYQADNAADFEAIKKELEGLKAKDEAEMMKLMAPHMEKIAALMAKQTELQKSHPALFENPKVEAAMAAMGGK